MEVIPHRGALKKVNCKSECNLQNAILGRPLRIKEYVSIIILVNDPRWNARQFGQVVGERLGKLRPGWI